MGDPAMLTAFINNAATLAPADKYGLVIWNHGGGIGGAAWDDAVALNGFVAVALTTTGLDRIFLTASQATVQRFPNAAGTAADLVDYMEQVMQFCFGVAIDATASAVIDAVRDAVFATIGSVPRAEGLAINLPLGATQADYTAVNYNFLVDAVPLWRTLVDVF